MANLFEIKMTREEIIDGLRSQYGSEFTTPEVRAFCATGATTAGAAAGAANDLSISSTTSCVTSRFHLPLVTLNSFSFLVTV